MRIIKDFVQSKLNTSLAGNAASTDVRVDLAVQPFNNVPDPSTTPNGICHLVLTDNINNPTKFEIISYTGRTVQSDHHQLTGVTRAVEGTAQVWAVGSDVLMAPVSHNVSPLLWIPDLANGNLSYQSGNIGIQKSAVGSHALDVNGKIKTNDTLETTKVITPEVEISNQASVTNNLTVGQNISANSLSVTANTGVGGALSVLGNVSGANLTLTGTCTTTGIQLPNSELFRSLRAGTWNPTITGTTGGVVGTYDVQIGTWMTIGRLMILSFSVAVANWSTAPTGDLVLGGNFPSIGMKPNFSGTLSQAEGIHLFKDFDNAALAQANDHNHYKQAIPSVYTLDNNTNQGLRIRLSSHSYESDAATVQVGVKTNTRNVQATDLLFNGTSGEKLKLTGSITFETKQDHTQ